MLKFKDRVRITSVVGVKMEDAIETSATHVGSLHGGMFKE